MSAYKMIGTSIHTDQVRTDVTRLGEQDVYWLNEGTHFRLYDKLGAHCMRDAVGSEGVYFAVFAPHARRVSVFGDFNGWDKKSHVLQPRSTSGVWEGFVEGVRSGGRYKFHIEGRQNGYVADKPDWQTQTCS